MKLKWLDLVNYCQYENRHVDFQQGVTGIIGPNGSGKSNLLGAVRAALTGVLTTAGIKQANIRSGAPSSDRSFIRLAFEHGSVEATVTRWFRPSSPTATLELSNGERVQGDTSVTKRLIDLVGVSADIINDIVIVAQREMFGFLDKSPTKRSEHFHRLFHTDVAEDIYKGLHERLALLPQAIQVPDLAAIRQRMVDAERKAEALHTHLVACPSVEKCRQGRDANAAVWQAASRKSDARHRHAAAELRVAGLNGAMMLARKAQADANASLAATQAALDTTRPQYTLSLQAKALLEGHAKAMRDFERSQSQRASYLTRLNALQPPQPPAGYMEVAARKQQLTTLAGRGTSDEAFIKAFAGGAGECPLCHAKHSEDAMREGVLAARDRLAATHSAYLQADRLDKDCQEYETATRLYTERLKTLQDALACYPEETAPVPPPASETAVATIGQFLQMERDVTAWQRAASQASQALGQHEGALAGAIQLAQSLATELAALPEYTPEQVHVAEENARGWDNAVDNRHRVERELVEAGHAVSMLNVELASATETATKQGCAQAIAARLRPIHDLFHRDAMPKFVTHRNLQRLECWLNEYLELFMANFRARAAEGLSFTAHFLSGLVQPAERLSEGQKTVLAIAYRVALNSVLAANLGLLCLDEPTAYLDRQYVTAFTPVLDRLREFSSSRGLQCLIITHEESLAPVFDQVVRL